jgi:hypothetical protein
MPKIINAGTNPNVVKIEPSPYKKCSVKVKMEVINVAGGQPKYTTNPDGTKKYHTKSKDPKNITRLPGTVVEYCAPLSRNGLLTGLDEIVENPYRDLDFYRPGWEEVLKGNKKIRRQELLEYKHNKPKGHYTNQVSETMSSKANMSADTPFYQRSEAKVLLNDGVTYLDLNNPIHEINYYMLRAHKMIANSFDELKSNPRATHYIVDETERANREASDTRKKYKFGARLEEIMEMSDNTISDFCKALHIKVKGTNKADCYSAISDYVARGDAQYDEFMDIYDLWADVATREVFEGHVELFNFLEIPGLLTMRNNKIFWSQPSSVGGKRESWEWKSKDQFIRQFLIAPEYQEEVEILRSQYRAKTRY